MDRLYALVRVRGAKLRRRRLGYSPITIENVLLLFLSLSLSLHVSMLRSNSGVPT